VILNVNTADPDDVERSALMLLALLNTEQHAKVMSDSRRPRHQSARRAKPVKEPVWPTPEQQAVLHDALADEDQARQIEARAAEDYVYPDCADTTVTRLNGTNGHATVDSQPDLFEDSEDAHAAARERLREIARDRGVLWIRPILLEQNVKRLGDLSIWKVRELLQDGSEPHIR
jgi:hypothetical protein